MIRLVRITKILPVLFAFTMKLASIFWQALGIISAVCSVWSSPLILSALSSFTREGPMAHWRGWFDNASHLEVQLRFPSPEILRCDACFSLQGSQFSNNLFSSLVVSQRTWEFQPNNWGSPDGSGCHPSKIKTENNPLSDFQNFREHSIEWMWGIGGLNCDWKVKLNLLRYHINQSPSNQNPHWNGLVNDQFPFDEYWNT